MRSLCRYEECNRNRGGCCLPLLYAWRLMDVWPQAFNIDVLLLVSMSTSVLVYKLCQKTGCCSNTYTHDIISSMVSCSHKSAIKTNREQKKNIEEKKKSPYCCLWQYGKTVTRALHERPIRICRSFSLSVHFSALFSWETYSDREHQTRAEYVH